MNIENQLFKTEIVYQKSSRPLALTGWRRISKLCLDKLLASFALILLLPLLLLVSIAIKLDSKGPIIFRQKRNGLNNDKFLIWKFRTMSVMQNGSDVKQAEKNDARITRIGNFLRKSSIDELPQLVNVLFGDMSIVGPRPHPVALNEKFAPLIKNYNHRTAMKPGLTGWAQIKGYSDPTDTVEQMHERIKCDANYSTNWSIWLDIKIILLTPYYGLLNKIRG